MKRVNQILLHIAFWLIFNVLQYARYIALNYGDISNAFYLVVGVQVMLNLITFYGSYFWVFAQIFDYAKLKSSGLLGLYIIGNIVIRIYISRFIFTSVERETWLDKYNSVWLQTLFVVTYTTLSFLVKFTIKWFHDQQLKAELENQKQASELALLRAQINPHFLFNTLNSLYSMALKKSENVAVSIAQLSDIMRYMLQESLSEKVSLKKEIEYIKSYIELQKLRTNDIDLIKFELKGDISDEVIAPMLLIPFVENAFKHGKKKADIPYIEITITIEGAEVKMSISNYIKEQRENNRTGTGLDIVKHRLDIIYKDKYQLKINENNNRKQFEVYLRLNLKP